MMKKLLKIVLSAVLCIALVLPVSGVCFAADGVITLGYTFNAGSNELKISGTVKAARGNIPLVMTLEKDGELICYMETVSGSSVGGCCEFSFDAAAFSDADVSADYDVYVSADFIKAEVRDVYAYAGIDAKYDMVKSLEEAADVSDMITVIENYGTSFGLTSDEIRDMSDDDKKIMAEMLLAGEYICPDDYVSDANIKIIASEIKKAQETVDEAKSVIEASAMKTEADVEVWLQKYGDVYGFNKDNKETAYDDAVAAEYFKKAKMTNELVDTIASNAKNARSAAEVNEIMIEEAVLELIADSNYYMIQNLVEDIPELFGIDTVKFAKLTSGQKMSIYQNVSGDYNTVEEFGDTVNEKTKTALNGSGGKDSPRGGGNNSGGGALGGKLQSGADAEDAVINSQVYVGFTDLEDCEWARESIEALYRRGVVNGKDETHFNPNDTVTRAEFSKMVTEALGLKASGAESGFSDVAADSWYASYVTAARENGIIEGDGKSFNPDGAITREDIAVILCRAMGIEAEEDSSVFTDYGEISDYAKEAVIGLYKAGVVNGTGNGAFEPKSNATRAEAAKMIYLALCQD